MDKFPLMQGGVSVGELITEQEALYTWFEARCRLPGEGLWCAWAVGDRGELRLGVLEPCGDRATIRRRFSARLTAPLGKLRQGEIRPAHPPEPEDWTPLERSAVRLRSPWLREQLHLVSGVLVREEQGRRELAVPYDVGRPFPLTALFCFAISAVSMAGATPSLPSTGRSGRCSEPSGGQRHFQKIPNDVFHISRGYDIITPRRPWRRGSPPGLRHGKTCRPGAGGAFGGPV